MAYSDAMLGRCCQQPRRRDCPLRPAPANDNTPVGVVAVGTIDDPRQGGLPW
ncbi:MAG TPA: hypothetical protein VGI78_26010 [Acetobacteraceae bacterium]|jgi:hypothetical protein